MKKLLLLSCLISVLASCGPDKESGFSIAGEVEGIKIGKIYLQKVDDSVLINLDSAEFKGNADFKLMTSLDQPQPLYLYLDVKDGAEFDDRFQFFAEDTTMTANTTLEDFEGDMKISGSKNHEVLQVFKDNNRKLNQTYTALLKRGMELDAAPEANEEVNDSLFVAYDKYLRKKVLYAINYAQLHKDLEVAPFILMEHATEANPVLLDSVYYKMPKKIQTSRFGKQLSEFLESTERLD
ncbi:DUF4369 domain-containing protein [Nonlabens xiamenensis]|uniref:DUF4369 domain-containing protein n=1 Tax=Nonlabens xiamenensis TaxID=2341043 RepID=UPI000F6139A7|nr:DUF4369 domain-containing protein [Nonlabens xiamenensis]